MSKRASRSAAKKAEPAPSGQANITAFMTPRIASGATLPEVRGRAKRVAVAEKAELDEEDSDELIETPYEKRPPSPTRPRSRNSSPQKSRALEDQPLPETPEIQTQPTATSALDTSYSESAQDDEIVGLASKYDNLDAMLGISSTPPESTPAPSKKRKGKPALVSPDTRSKLDLISEFASQAKDEKFKEQEVLRLQKTAEEINKKRQVKPTATEKPTGRPARGSRAQPRRAPTSDGDGSNDEEEVLVTYEEGAISDAVAAQMAAESDDEMEYTEENLRRLEEEHKRVLSHKEDITEAEEQLRRHAFLGKNARVLLATQAGEMDMAPSFLRVLEQPLGAAIITKGLNEHTLPLNISPTTNLLCRGILDGAFARAVMYRKTEPSPVFINFLLQVITLYDGVPAERGDPLQPPFSFDEHGLVRDQHYEELHRQIRVSEVHAIVQEAKKVIQLCVDRHPSLPWRLTRDSVFECFAQFGIPKQLLGATIGAHFQFDVKNFVPEPEESDEEDDDAPATDPDMMQVDDPAPQKTKRTPRKKKRRAVDDVFPSRNLLAFVELIKFMVERKKTTLSMNDMFQTMLILAICMVDDKCEDADLQQCLPSCISAIVDAICVDDVTPVQLATQVCAALVPAESFAKARLLCRNIATRLTPRTENGDIFVRSLSFFFAKSILGQPINTADVLPTGPSLEHIRQAIINTPRPTPHNADLYWVVRCAVILLQTSMKYHIHETRANKAVLDGIKVALEKLSKSMKEDPNAPTGLTTCKEVTLLASVHIGLLQSAFTKGGMNTIQQYLSRADDSKKSMPAPK